MSNADNDFVQATDNLIALYRSLERRAIDLPSFSAMPLLISLWAFLKFEFLLMIGVILIIPVNLVIFVRNSFPGHWKYRRFFIQYIAYVLCWIWRGEAPFAPSIFIRPLLDIFMKRHFEHRLRRLRLEILLHDRLSDATRSSLTTRLDAALERWKSPRFATLFFTVLLPGIISFPSWYQQLIDFLTSIGFRVPALAGLGFLFQNMSTGGMVLLSLFGIGYLVAIPVTAFMAKRGLFIGVDPNLIYFPGAQEGAGAYLREREILNSVGLRAREPPIDLWILGVSYILTFLTLPVVWEDLIAWSQSFGPAEERALLIQLILQIVVWVVLFSVAAFRRGRTGRV